MGEKRESDSESKRYESVQSNVVSVRRAWREGALWGEKRELDSKSNRYASVAGPLQSNVVSVKRAWREGAWWGEKIVGLRIDEVRISARRFAIECRFENTSPENQFEWYGGVFLLLQQRSKHPREMVITGRQPKISVVMPTEACRRGRG